MRQQIQYDPHNDLLELFGLEDGFTQAQLKRAYRKGVSQYHPDKFTRASQQEKDKAEAKIRAFNTGYEILNDDDKKRQYLSARNLAKTHASHRQRFNQAQQNHARPNPHQNAKQHAKYDMDFINRVLQINAKNLHAEDAENFAKQAVHIESEKGREAVYNYTMSISATRPDLAQYASYIAVNAINKDPQNATTGALVKTLIRTNGHKGLNGAMVENLAKKIETTKDIHAQRAQLSHLELLVIARPDLAYEPMNSIVHIMTSSHGAVDTAFHILKNHPEKIALHNLHSIVEAARKTPNFDQQQRLFSQLNDLLSGNDIEFAQTSAEQVLIANLNISETNREFTQSALLNTIASKYNGIFYPDFFSDVVDAVYRQNDDRTTQRRNNFITLANVASQDNQLAPILLRTAVNELYHRPGANYALQAIGICAHQLPPNVFKHAVKWLKGRKKELPAASKEILGETITKLEDIYRQNNQQPKRKGFRMFTP